VAQFLQTIGLLQYLSSFVSAGYDNALVLSNLDNDDLDHINITLPGHRKTILLHSKKYSEIKTNGERATSPPQAHHSHLSPSAPGKVPILQRAAERKLEGLNYWSRAKFRTTPFDHQLPVVNGKSQPKIRLFLVRHGMSKANEDISLYTSMADHAIPLCSQGEQQAIQTGEAIAKYFQKLYNTDKPEAGFHCRLWTSPYLRTRQTSDLLKQHSSGICEELFSWPSR